jgi:hypothetical protein
MGFKAVVVYNLDFEGTPYEGLEVKTRSLPIGRLREIIKFAQLRDKDKRDPEKVVGMLDEMLEKFSSALISWNAEREDDTPIPANLQGLQELDTNLAIEIILAWINAVAGVSATSDLGKDSSGGEKSPELLLPMEAL